MKSTRWIILAVVAAATLFMGSAGIVSAARPAPWLTAHLYSTDYDAPSGKTQVYCSVAWADYRRTTSYDLTIHNDTDDREIKHDTVAYKEPSANWYEWEWDTEAGDHSGDTYTITMKLLAKNGTVLASTYATYPRP
jgi:hypothetical protein